MPPTSPTTERERLKLIIVDDHPLFAEGLSLTLRNLDAAVELLCACSLAEARRIISEQTDLDLLLLDLNLPDGKGLSLLRYIQDQQLFIPTIVISASDDTLEVRAALKAGANGFISKATGGEHILQQLKKALKGEIVLPDFYQTSDARHANQDTLPVPAEPLTPRQYEVLKLVAEGLPNKAICQRLNLTEHTVKSHIKALFQNLAVHTRTECVHAATLMGLLE